MWRKRTRPEPCDLVIPDDVGEAVAIREEAQQELRVLKRQEPFVRRLTTGLIDRQGKNHYIELLYEHVPRGF